MGNRIGAAAAFSMAAVMSVLAAVSCSCGAAEARTVAGMPTPAFPGAEGFGAYTPGGRGGKVYLVTTLEDYGHGQAAIPGSLRAAVEAQGPRIVIFRVGGNIELKRTLQISNSYLTIAGQTAPGDGICLAGFSTMVTGAHDVILRHLRFRPGDTSQDAVDAFCVYGGHDVIVDHCTANWSLDELISTQRSKNITVQWCMISLPLDRSFHAKGAHGAGSLINGLGGISYHHNLYAHCRMRNPRAQDDLLLDFRNNVIYNWDDRAGYNVQDPVRINYVGNYLKPGPNTRGRNVAFVFGGPMKAYVAGNVLEGNPQASSDNWLMMKSASKMAGKTLKEAVGLDAPLPMPPMTTTSAELAYQQVLDDVGATLPKRDKLDAMVVEQVKTGGGKFIDSQTDVGGWPALAGGQAPPDSDSDGMPDDWEKAHKLNPNDASDSSGDADGDGHTNVEEWINATNPRMAEPPPPAVDLAKLDEQVEQCLAESHKIVNASGDDVDTRVKAMCQAIKPSAGKPLAPDAVAQLPKKQEIDVGNGVKMELVLIPEGTFLMGSPPDEEGREKGDGETSEDPQHPVTISRPFYMGATEVTREQLTTITGQKLPRGDKLFPGLAAWPDAAEFCLKLTKLTGKRFRLPTEAEWEYACRAGTTTPFSTGSTISTDQANYDGKFVYGNGKVGVFRDDFLPVKSFAPNPWGLYDMHGNAYEWVYDTLGKYPAGPVTDPIGPDTNPGLKVMRGGIYNGRPQYLRSASRYRYLPRVDYGFRVVMEVE